MKSRILYGLITLFLFVLNQSFKVISSIRDLNKKYINILKYKRLDYKDHNKPYRKIDLREGRCTCGSGAHPRKCKVHPYGWDLHVAYLNLYSELIHPNPNLHEDYNQYVIELINAYNKALKAKYKK